jgi:hypothetical protein
MTLQSDLDATLAVLYWHELDPVLDPDPARPCPEDCIACDGQAARSDGVYSGAVLTFAGYLRAIVWRDTPLGDERLWTCDHQHRSSSTAFRCGRAFVRHLGERRQTDD